jgi:GGDEF domain-containing protein
LDADWERSTRECGRVAEKISAVLSAPYLLQIAHAGKGEECVEQICTVSIGVSMFVNHEVSQGDLIKCADVARYQAKKTGGNAVQFYEA